MAQILANRQCPRDWQKLAPRRITLPGLDVTADQCPKCSGFYFDKGEVKRITGHDKLHELLTKNVGLDSDSKLVCPGCGMVMDLEDAAGVPVEVCLSCNGVWLDAGELDKLKAAPNERFDDFSPEKIAELERAKKVKAEDRKRWWNQFMYRLKGQDLIKKRK